MPDWSLVMGLGVALLSLLTNVWLTRSLLKEQKRTATLTLTYSMSLSEASTLRQNRKMLMDVLEDQDAHIKRLESIIDPGVLFSLLHAGNGGNSTPGSGNPALPK